MVPTPTTTTTVPEPAIEDRPYERLGEVVLRIHAGESAGQSLTFTTTRITIGRASGMDLCLSDASVSHAHADLVIDDDGVWLEDRESRNGTWLDHARIRIDGRVRLELGTRFWISKTVEIELAAANPITVQAAQADAFGHLHGRSQQIREVYSRLRALAPTALHVAVFGEIGTGKERLARTIHEASGRTGAFVVLDGSAARDELLAALLFGQRRGTAGAEHDIVGVFERADGGTLYLDEIGDLSIEVQARLLRVIESGEYCRVGETTVRRTNVRLIVATRHDLRKLVANGRFREDLFFRVAQATIELPPLRRRRGDIPFLARWFVHEFAAEVGKTPIELTPGAIRTLEAYPWEGNVRQLRTLLKRVVLQATEAVIDAPQIEYGANSLRRDVPIDPEELADHSWSEAQEICQGVYIRTQVQRHGLNYRRLEEVTELSRRTLQDHVTRYVRANGRRDES